MDDSNQHTEKNDAKSLLDMYCKQNEFDEPMYSCTISRFNMFIGNVTVQGVKYTTSPLEYGHESLAQSAVAEVALNNLKEFPISHDSSEVIAWKLYNCINSNGVILKYLPNIFEQKYEQTLPDGWSNIIQNRPEMFSIQCPLANVEIVFKNTSQPTPSQATKELNSHPIDRTMDNLNSNDLKATTNNIDLNETLELAAPKLPWHESQWSIDVTWVISTVDIWGCIVDSDGYNNLNNALVQIEQNLSNGIYPSVCQTVIDGGIYLTIQPSGDMPNEFTTYRVRVETIDDKKKKALCFYIDDGFQEWLSFDSSDSKLYQLERNLFEIPAQAIHFCLFNLEDFAENPLATEVAKKRLSDKCFTAKIKCTKDEFEKQVQSDDLEPRVRVILKDTDFDILVNKEMIQEICTKMQPPQLEPRKTNIVYVKHIDENGDIFCRLQGNKDMHLIKQIIHRLTADGIQDAYRVDPTELCAADKCNELRLVYDKLSGRWYRANILPSNAQSCQQALCKLVDNGQIKHIEHEHIYDLSRLSLALSNYPYQAIKVRLDGLDHKKYSPKVVERLRELLCCHKPIYFEVVTRSEVPFVIVWKMLNGIQCKINDSIQREIQLESSPHLVPLPDSDSFSSSDDEDDPKQTGLPQHPTLELNRFYEATVVTAVNPSKFYVRLKSTEPNLDKMNNCLWKDCENSKRIFTTHDIKINQIYAARAQDGDWHRVKILKMLPNDEVEVKKCDAGDIRICNIGSLRPLHSTYFKIPQTVFAASLHELEPRQSIWNKDDCDQFQQLTVGKLFKINIKRIQSDGSQFVAHLILISTNNLNISEQLVRERRAKFV